jgi:biopolymer transport protein ExbB/TolQ
MNGSLLDMINDGGIALWFIVVLSVIALAVALERAVAQWQFTTRARALADTVGRCLNRGAYDEGRSACERSPSPLADVFLVGYERLGRARPEHLAAAVHRERQRVNQDLRARLWILGTIGATAPFVGLFGTVIGIMNAMGGFKGQKEVPFDMVSGPISEALIATAAGIFVAVEAVILFNFFNQRAGRIATELKLLTDEFLEQLAEAPAPSETTGRGGKNSSKSAKADGEGKGDGDREAA